MIGAVASAPRAVWSWARSWRDRLLVDARFRRLAAAFPATRPIVRRRAAALFDLCAGFVYSQILAAVVRLRLLERLAVAARTEEELARGCDLPRESTARLLAAAAALGLVERRGRGSWGLGPQGAALLGTPGLDAMIEHHALLYADLADPVALLRRPRGAGRLAGYWPYATAADPAALQAGSVAAYSALMAASQPAVAAEILDAYPVHRHRRLLDVGGGEGAFLAAVAARAPALELVLLDLPAVAERARRRLAAAGLAERVTVVAGDARRDPLPPGADLVSLVRVLHDHDDAEALALLRAAHAALAAGGVVLIGEPMAGVPGARRAGDAYFGLYLLAMGRGRPRRPGELADLLRAAGFVRPRLRPTRLPLLASVVTAIRPRS